MTTALGDPAMICQGATIQLNGAASMPAPGHSLNLWTWDLGIQGIRYTTGPTTNVTFNTGGVHTILLTVRDESGCSSEIPDTLHVLVSATPDLSGTFVPDIFCAGDIQQLLGSAEGFPMITNTGGCTAPDNGAPLVDNATTTSLLTITGNPNTTISNLGELGDICMDIEHSFMGDLAITVTCPNGQSVVLHQQGGGSTYLGDANDNDGGTIVPGSCFRYCFGDNPDFGTLLESAVGSTSPNVVPVSQGTAIAPGRYTPITPLSQLIGCPVNGTWTFSSADLWAADNGYLCGWCITLGEGADSTFYSLGPVLGTSSDSTFWTGPGVINDPLEPGNALIVPEAGMADLTYTVLDSYGCVHQMVYPIDVGVDPEPLIVENTDLGLLCVQVAGNPTLQWNYNGVPVSGAAGTCYTPPGPGVVSVTATTPQGCSGSDTFLTTAVTERSEQVEFVVFPVPNNGDFTVQLAGLATPMAELRVLDMTGRVVQGRSVALSAGTTSIQMSTELAPGAYFVELLAGDLERVQRIVVR